MAQEYRSFDDIKDKIKFDFSPVENFIQNLKDSKFFGEIPVLSDALEFITKCFAGLAYIIMWMVFQVAFLLLGLIWDLVDSMLLFPLAKVYDRMVVMLADKGYISPHAVEISTDIFNGMGPLTNVMKLLATLYMGLAITKDVTETSKMEFQKLLNQKFRPNLADPASVIRTAFVAPELYNDCVRVLQKHGYSDNDIKMMFVANYRLYDVDMIRTLYLRKVFDKNIAYERMRELGYTDTRIEEMMQSWNIIPPVSDLLYMVGKEAFEPDQVAKYGLGDEFPEEQVDWMEKQGLSRYWQEKYWAAHWNYPSPQQVLEMLHRGKIDTNDVYQYYRVVEMPPVWREKLMEISYHPYTRVDVRRMHNVGVLGDDDLIRAYMDEGYDLEHATKMSEFTIKYNQGTDKELTRSQIEQGYVAGLLTRAEADLFLREIGYTPDYAQYIVDYQDWKMRQDYIDEYIALLKDQYKQNIIDDRYATSELNKLGVMPDRIELMLKQWAVLKKDNTKQPSKKDIDDMLMFGIITVQEWRDEMRLLGYKEKYIMWYEELLSINITDQLENMGE